MSWHGACASGTSRVLSVASLHWLKMDVPIPAPAACEVRSVIKFLNAQGIAPIEIDRQLCQVYGPNVMSKQMKENTISLEKFIVTDINTFPIGIETFVKSWDRQRGADGCQTLVPILGGKLLRHKNTKIDPMV
ncbi:hypothetical protein ANN_07892 [Periplaneta americana]|uniref:Uncharacterized protein n=1 Tax=Periplaneta americana TaxID=6978 RepID=A0ABQ8SZV8_PERAM|nr:hypothetical protein ANN_07892 [Periplaneta americana]